MKVCCDNKGCIYNKELECSLSIMHYENRICQSYINHSDLNRLREAPVPTCHRKKRKYKRNEGRIIK